jgi:hypothetical protein
MWPSARADHVDVIQRRGAINVVISKGRSSGHQTERERAIHVDITQISGGPLLWSLARPFIWTSYRRGRATHEEVS